MSIIPFVRAEPAGQKEAVRPSCGVSELHVEC
jgi:hypothetical protein